MKSKIKAVTGSVKYAAFWMPAVFLIAVILAGCGGLFEPDVELEIDFDPDLAELPARVIQVDSERDVKVKIIPDSEGSILWSTDSEKITIVGDNDTERITIMGVSPSEPGVAEELKVTFTPLGEEPVEAAISLRVFEVRIEIEEKEDAPEVTLKHDDKRDLEIVVEPEDLNVIAYRMWIRWDSDDPINIHLLSQNQEEKPWRFRVAGKFRLTAQIRIVAEGAEWFWSQDAPDEEPLEVQFPPREKVIADGYIQAKVGEAWTMTIDACTPSGRKEYGFLILLDTGDDEYDIFGDNGRGSFVEGEEFPHDAGAEIEFPPFTRGPITPITSGVEYIVGHFHTHPPYTYGPQYHYQLVGPSEDDEEHPGHVPGFVRDYTAVTYDELSEADQEQIDEFEWPEGHIPAGYPPHVNNVIQDRDNQVYSYGVERKETPE